MSIDEESGSADVLTEEAFHDELRTLLVKASEQNLDIRGSWPASNSSDDVVFDVEITEVPRQSAVQRQETDDPIVSVVTAVAARENVEPTDLPPLTDSIDPDILERLQRLNTTADKRQQRVQFQYHGYEITVDATGSVTIRE